MERKYTGTNWPYLRFLMGSVFVEREIKYPPVPHSVHEGPVEGILIVDGRPQVECADVPSITFESIQALQKILLNQPVE